MASPAARLLAPSSDDPAPSFAMSDKSGRHVRIYACAQRDTLLNQLHMSASTKLGVKVTGTLHETSETKIFFKGLGRASAKVGVKLAVQCAPTTLRGHLVAVSTYNLWLLASWAQSGAQLWAPLTPG